MSDVSRSSPETRRTTLAEEIRDAILDDVTDRRGWRQEWDEFDDDVQEEIKDVWLIVINEILEERGIKA